MFSDKPGVDVLILSLPVLLILAPLFIMGLSELEGKWKRAKQEEILEQKRELNKKQIIEAEKRAAIHKSLRPSREELERKRQEELIEENRKRLASKQPDDDSELARLQRLKADWLEDKIE
jgi:hypothetical protein